MKKAAADLDELRVNSLLIKHSEDAVDHMDGVPVLSWTSVERNNFHARVPFLRLAKTRGIVSKENRKRQVCRST
jgi:hypothetical protein